MRSLQERLDDLLPRILDPDFKKERGLSGQANYYVFTYDPRYEMVVRGHVGYLLQRINGDSSVPLHVVECDLYEIILTILQAKGFLAKNFAMEQKNGSERVLKATIHALRLTQDDNQVIAYIRKHVTPGDLVFITGVGKAFPLIRSHHILNNMFRATDHSPVLLFFPGRYDGQELVLFDAIHDENNYRGLPIVPD
ncbi:MAG: DUF1788 domain-containing protein [Sporolactobacillus sp.]|jgi:hypothetical protein|nr:DUF1788 domain-containing protein [Sporolactobacillus sp.]